MLDYLRAKRKRAATGHFNDEKKWIPAGSVLIDGEWVKYVPDPDRVPSNKRPKPQVRTVAQMREESRRRYWRKVWLKRRASVEDKTVEDETVEETDRAIELAMRKAEAIREMPDDPRDYYRLTYQLGDRQLGGKTLTLVLREEYAEPLLRLAARFGSRPFTAAKCEWLDQDKDAGRVLRRIAKRGLMGSYRLVQVGKTGGRARYQVVNVLAKG